MKKRPGRGRKFIVVLVVTVAVAVGAVAVYVFVDPFGARSPATTIDSGAPMGLAQVTKGDLSARSMQNGTLGYAGDYELVNKASGTLTKLPAVGDVIRQGKPLYWVDGEPVVVLNGGYVPVYRELSWGTEGVDVRQLNKALVALGYASKSALDPNSDYFGKQTYKAVQRLQDDVGMDETGKLELGQMIFAPANEIRITEVKGVRGGSAGPNQSIMKASSTARQVTVELSASQQSSVAVGDDVTITLPTGKTTKGKVSSVGKVATKTDTSTTIEVLITPSAPKETGQLDQAPVQVSIVSETVKDVLSVPVNALLALAGGGYAVEVVDADGAHRLVAVKRGLFDDSGGRVEVSGEGLVAGQNVVVPAS
ncbi:efflux RND transporter periplasmic adaptor subunit [Plantactinospora solaniradicis]|uniref:Efflux RND transporter periplasmic adaptor subunit n=1 Tax=Plantactinospora solaniradicis TaxID=1723736 RepID=A0ABW1KM70_9ACTN